MTKKRKLEDPDFEMGAWLLTCNPRVWDVSTFRSEEPMLESWSIRQSYRLDHLEVGQPVVLWVTGSNKQKETPGVWGVGAIAGKPYSDRSVGVDGEDYWKNREEQRRQDMYVPVSIQFLPEPIKRSTLLANDKFAGSEIKRNAKQSNPQILSRSEFEVITAELPAGMRNLSSWCTPPSEENFDAEVASRSGIAQEVVDDILLEQDLMLRHFVSEGVAVFHPLGVQCEAGHPAPQLLEKWPIDGVSDRGTFLAGRLGDQAEEIVGKWVALPDQMFLGDRTIDDHDGETYRRVLDAFWEVAAERGATDPFGPLKVDVDEHTLFRMIEDDPADLIDEFGPGEFERTEALPETPLLFRLANDGGTLGILLDTDRASERTLERAHRAMTDLAALAPGEHARLVVVADGRDRAYRLGEAASSELFYRSVQELIVWGPDPEPGEPAGSATSSS